MAKKNKTKKQNGTKTTKTKHTKRTPRGAEMAAAMKQGIATLKKRHSRHTGAGAVDHTKGAHAAAVVKGPQLGLPKVEVKVEQAHVPAKGNPLVAFRHDEATVNAFVKKHGGRDQAWKAIKTWMSGQVGR